MSGWNEGARNDKEEETKKTKCPMETLNRVADEEVAIFCKPSMDKINYQERQRTSICPIFDSKILVRGGFD